MAQLAFDGISIIRYIIVVMVLLTVIVGFVANGEKFIKQILWIAVIVGVIGFALIPYL